MLYYKKASVFLLNLLRLFAFAGSGGRDHKGRAFRCNLFIPSANATAIKRISTAIPHAKKHLIQITRE